MQRRIEQTRKFIGAEHIQMIVVAEIARLEVCPFAPVQHDETAVDAVTSMGYQNVMFGSDYPHLEGTYGHTQKTLHELFDGIEPAVSHRIRLGAFKELFPHVGDPPVS